MEEYEDFALEEYLKEYIVIHIDYGYSDNSISRVLSNYGYPKEMVENLFKQIKVSPRRKKKSLRQKIKPSKLTEDLFEYVIKLLVDYVDKQLDQGYSKKEILNVLLKNEFENYVIEQSFMVIENKKTLAEVVSYCKKKGILFNVKNQGVLRKGKTRLKSLKKKKNKADRSTSIMDIIRFPAWVLYGVSLIVWVFVVFFMTFITGSILSKVFLGFFATFFSITATYAYILFLPKAEIRRFVPLFAVVLTLIVFFVIIFLGKTYLLLSEYHVVLMLNVILVFFLSSIIAIFSKEAKGRFNWHPSKTKDPVVFADSTDNKIANKTDQENRKIFDYLKDKE